MFRHLMSAKARSNAGCWTCRLRRKKCDEKRPVCDSCAALEITCYTDDAKPDWMDGGQKQKLMAEKIKAQVKKQASQRRDRKYMDMLESGTRDVSLNSSNGTGTNPESTAMSGASDTDHASGLDMGSTPASSNTSGASPPEIPWHSQFLVNPEDKSSATGSSTEVHFAMIYLDYVFPHLFPFYRPPILAGGRGWILDVLQSNKSVWHTAISIASYFFSIVMANGDKLHEECTDRMVHQLQSQLEMGLRELQRVMTTINSSVVTCAGVRDKLLVLQAMLQMLIFEVATSNKDHWRMHLDAAITMFQQILPRPEKWTETMNALYSMHWPPPEMGLRRPFSTNQAALRFFTANILYIDVMASITLEQAPRLHKYQDHIIPGCKSHSPNDVQSFGSLVMEDFVGLQNWVVQILGDVAALDAWKKEQKKLGSLSMSELVQRGKVIEDAIKGGLCILEATDMPASTNSVNSIVADPSFPSHNSVVEQAPCLKVNNTIWLQATLTYLYVVISGWSPGCPEIRFSVSRMTTLLAELPPNTCLRTLVWPFCIAGCLSPPEGEEQYRDMVRRMGPLSVFGTAREAMQIMEEVWSRRDQIDENWDVSKCLNILGHGVLLI